MEKVDEISQGFLQILPALNLLIHHAFIDLKQFRGKRAPSSFSGSSIIRKAIF